MLFVISIRLCEMGCSCMKLCLYDSDSNDYSTGIVRFFKHCYLRGHDNIRKENTKNKTYETWEISCFNLQKMS